MEEQNIIKQLTELKNKLDSLWESFEIDKKLKKLSEMEKQMSSANFWDDKDQANEVIEKMNNLKTETSLIVDLKTKAEENLELLELDVEIDKSFKEEIKIILKNFEKLEISMLLKDEHDKANVFLEIQSGAGGTEACDWAEILFRMYSRYSDANNFKYEILSYLPGEEAGLKSVTLHIKGKYAYGYLKHEKGIHRLVRISPFDSSKRRHTSFASVEVMPEIDTKIEVEINDKDLKIDVFRSSGKGGQGVNTTDSAVRITHLPTGIVVTCQNERSQIQNKDQAMKVLKNKIYILEESKKKEELKKLKGESKDIEFGSQIRSYVLHPYSMVKDHRTEVETANVDKVLDGDINLFIEASLKS